VFRILGNLEAVAGGERLPLGGPSEQKVLAVLLPNAGRVVPVALLVDALWDGEPPATAVKQARNAVGRLRRLLAVGFGPNAVATENGGYRIRAAGDMLDAQLFETRVSQAAAAASAGDAAEAAALLRCALELWRGPR
jgi:DNA-binding SARP family transcriptional activator